MDPSSTNTRIRTRLELATRRWALLIDTAPDSPTDRSAQCNATRWLAIGPDHSAKIYAKPISQSVRNATARRIVALCGIKIDTKGGAARAAACTRIHSRWCRQPTRMIGIDRREDKKSEPAVWLGLFRRTRLRALGNQGGEIRRGIGASTANDVTHLLEAPSVPGCVRL